MRGVLLPQFAGKSASTDDFRTIAEKNYGDQLTWFFSQWLDSTGAPEFKVKYTTYRLGGAAAQSKRKRLRVSASPGKSRRILICFVCP